MNKAAAGAPPDGKRRPCGQAEDRPKVARISPVRAAEFISLQLEHGFAGGLTAHRAGAWLHGVRSLIDDLVRAIVQRPSRIHGWSVPRRYCGAGRRERSV